MFYLRSPRDEYSTVIGRCTLSRDPYPQWRQLAWSGDCDMLAYADSRGNVEIYDLLGTFICKIPTVITKSKNTLSYLYFENIHKYYIKV